MEERLFNLQKQGSLFVFGKVQNKHKKKLVFLVQV